mgnify:CR=1 FL=1
MDIPMMASLASNKDGDGAKKKSMYNLKLTSEQVDKLGDVLNARGWPTREVQYARHAFDGDNVKVVAYESGKLVVQGKGTEEFVTNILEPEVTGEFKLGYEAVSYTHLTLPTIVSE